MFSKECPANFWYLSSSSWYEHLKFGNAKKTILAENDPENQSASNCWETSQTSNIACIYREQLVNFAENRSGSVLVA